ncbi:MAG: hypothetical protein JRF34_08565, partial [Deltaproteobacteria bacterium]|nr:hypothetical protein [Deltaproteobacteria bacterium]
KGEIDMGWFYDEARPILKKDPNLLYEAGNNNLVLHKHYFNFRRWPMNDIRFRRAMWMGADWKNIVINARAYKSGQYAPTLLDYSEYFNPEAAKLVPSYNPEEAKKLIKAVEKDAGKKIPPIFWLDTNSAIGKNIAEPAKIQLTQIGVTLNLQLLSHAIWYEKVLRDPKIEWDMAGYGAGFAVHPAQGFRYFETDSATAVDGKSLGGYSNPELDRLIKKIESATNAEEEKKYVHEAEMVLLKDVASLPLSAYRMLVGYNKSVKGFKLNNTLNIYPTNPYSNIWIEK